MFVQGDRWLYLTQISDLSLQVRNATFQQETECVRGEKGDQAYRGRKLLNFILESLRLYDYSWIYGSKD